MLLRIFITLFAFIAPLGIYYIYMRYFFDRSKNITYQKYALLISYICVIILTSIYFFTLSQDASDNIDGVFVPATLSEDGHIINSYIK